MLCSRVPVTDIPCSSASLIVHAKASHLFVCAHPKLYENEKSPCRECGIFPEPRKEGNNNTLRLQTVPRIDMRRMAEDEDSAPSLPPSAELEKLKRLSCVADVRITE
jgi:hypothetical protein